jgi:hypothetical protein
MNRGTPRRPRQHAAALAVARLGTSLRAICRGYGLPRSVLYLALDGSGWARGCVRKRLPADLAGLLLGEERAA